MGSSKSGNFRKRVLTLEQRKEAIAMAKKHGQSIAARAFNVTRGYIWQLLHPDYRPKKSSK